MGLILGIIVAVGTVLMVLLIIGADMMSDAPSVQGTSPLPTFIIGMLIACALIFTHFVHIGW